MDLTCFVYPGWEPRIRPAAAQRAWMDDAPESYPYRCLPLAIANSHGWEVLSPCGFTVEWNGGVRAEDVIVRCDPGTVEQQKPVALFGVGTVTLHVEGLFRTPPGWNLHVSGPPNSFKDGIAPLTGVIETDWSPYSFTMNWRLTRRHHVVRFEENEPIAFFFPVQRGAVDTITPRFADICEDPDLKAKFERWSASRDAFHREVAVNPPQRPSDKWQKLYFRGLDPDGRCPVAGHQAKLRVNRFERPDLTGNAVAAMARAPAASLEPATASASGAGPADAITKRKWLLAAQREQRALSAAANALPCRAGLSDQAFLDDYYAPGRPVVLTGEIDDWPALAKWTPAYLQQVLGACPVAAPGERPPGADAAALASLDGDIGRIAKLLDHAETPHGGLLDCEAAGSFTPLHHGLANNLLVQLVGRKRIFLAAADETPNFYNRHHVFSDARDVTKLDLALYPDLAGVTFHEIELEPGDTLFIPLGWWHQMEALDVSVSMRFANFRWRNDFVASYPTTQ